MNRKLIFVLALFLVSTCVTAQRDFSDSETTKIVMLGTGNPNPNPLRSGSCIAVVVNDTPYIFDFGPGLIRQAAAMSPRYGGTVKGLDVKNIKMAFLTHLHSDHTTGYPDLILTPWVMGRDEPLEVYGPEGIVEMTEHILEAYQEDIKYRLYGQEPANNMGWRVNSHEIMKEDTVYLDDNIIVEAFPVHHGTWPDAWGFRLTTPDKVIVISGDSSPSDKLIEYASNADILIHEVYSKIKCNLRNEFWQTYHSQNHTSTIELADIANKTQPGIIILYHVLSWGQTNDELIEEISAHYKGKVVVGEDLDIY